MNSSFFWRGLLLLVSICTEVTGQPSAVPSEVTALVQRADPQANIEYCGSASTNRVNYYLFILSRRELTGVVLIKHSTGQTPEIADADTSLFPFRHPPQPSVAQPLQEAVEALLSRRNLKKNRPSRHNQTPEISAVGLDIDQVIFPICGFRFGAESTREMLRLLRGGPTISVDPKSAPPGSIVVSPTQFFHDGPVFLGHAGILGSDGSIYSADARYGGAWTKNFTLSSWLKRFSGTNGTYAFVLRAQLGEKPGQL